jgi:polyisoprenoid-binding protein YceI
MKRSALAVILALSAAPGLQAGEVYSIDKNHSETGFSVRHLVSTVRGRFNDFEGTIDIDHAKPEASTVAFTVKTASIDTGAPDRDKHLKTADFFDVEKYPELTFKSVRVVAKDKDHFDVTGPLTLHGVTKDVTVQVNATGFVSDKAFGDRAGFDVSTTLNRKDFGITWNKTLDTGGLAVGDDVKVQITLEAVKKAPAATK